LRNKLRHKQLTQNFLIIHNRNLLGKSVRLALSRNYLRCEIEKPRRRRREKFVAVQSFARGRFGLNYYKFKLFGFGPHGGEHDSDFPSIRMTFHQNFEAEKVFELLNKQPSCRLTFPSIPHSDIHSKPLYCLHPPSMFDCSPLLTTLLFRSNENKV
jgi:hypothetical protein